MTFFLQCLWSSPLQLLCKLLKMKPETSLLACRKSMKDSLKQSIQSNHNLLSEVFWVTGIFSIIVAVLKIKTPLINFFERLPGYFINYFFFTLLRKKSSCMQTTINAGNSIESGCLFHSMCFSYSMFLIHLFLLQRVSEAQGGKEYLRQIIG